MRSNHELNLYGKYLQSFHPCLYRERVCFEGLECKENRTQLKQNLNLCHKMPLNLLKGQLYCMLQIRSMKVRVLNRRATSENCSHNIGSREYGHCGTCTSL